jgi:hypothetical protein
MYANKPTTPAASVSFVNFLGIDNQNPKKRESNHKLNHTQGKFV